MRHDSPRDFDFESDDEYRRFRDLIAPRPNEYERDDDDDDDSTDDAE